MSKAELAVNVLRDQETLRITGVRRLGAAEAKAFCHQASADLQPGLLTISIDLSETSFMDSAGMAALLALHKAASHHNSSVTLRLLNPSRPMHQLLRLTRLDRVFQIVS